jgi:hypothetical protein
MPRAAPDRAELEEDDIDFDDLRIRKPPPQWTTTATITSVVAWGALAAHNVIAMPKIDGVANVSFERVSSSSRFVPKYVVKCIFSSERASERVASWKMNSDPPRAFGVGLRGEARGLKIDID